MVTPIFFSVQNNSSCDQHLELLKPDLIKNIFVFIIKLTKGKMFCNAYPGSFLVQIEREKAKHAKEMSGLEKQIAQLKDQLDKARHGLQDHVIFYTFLNVSFHFRKTTYRRITSESDKHHTRSFSAFTLLNLSCRCSMSSSMSAILA